MNNKLYIIGAGPAGLTSGIYGLWAGFKAIIFENGLPGGLVNMTPQIENYPGFPEGVNGMELAERLVNQFQRLGGEIIKEKVIRIDSMNPAGKGFKICTEKQTVETPTVILATGTSPRKLNIPGEKEFSGRGVSWCAVCDGPFFKGKVTAVIGGGNSALDGALHLANLSSKVYIIHRREKLRAAAKLQEKAKANPKVHCLYNTVAEKIMGSNVVEKIKVKNKRTGESLELKVDGVFEYLGRDPNLPELNFEIKRDQWGYIITEHNMMSSVKGLFAAGDIRSKELQQVVTATSDGAIAGLNAVAILQET